jgi:hypothetical protein
MFPRGKHLKVLDRVVLSVLVLVMDVLITTKPSADHGLSYRPMFMTPEELSVCCWLYCWEAPDLGSAIVCTPHIDRRHVVWVAISTDSLGMHAAKSVGALFYGRGAERVPTKPCWLAGRAAPHR